MESTNILSDFAANVALHFAKVRPLLPMYLHLILAAIFPIYTGAHASLSRPASAAKPAKKAKKTAESEDDDDDDDEDKVQKMEGLSNADAIILPVTAGLVLAGLYFLIKKYGAEVINLIMGYYFAAVGVFSVAKLVNDAMNILVGLLFPTHFRYKWSLRDGGVLMTVKAGERKVVSHPNNVELESSSGLPVPNALLDIPLPEWLRNRIWDLRNTLKQKYTLKTYIHTVLDLNLNITLINVFSSLAGLGIIIYANTVSKPWYLTNLQGFAFSYAALQLLSPTTFATGSLILSSLFCYDIWAVFFTPLMVGVAKNLDQPIKLLFPRSEPSATPGEPAVRGYSMLGLGDIVIPGIMIGLALRFDLYNFYLKKQSRHTTPTSPRKIKKDEEKPVNKAPYIPVTGRWGDKFWTSGLPPSTLPAHLQVSFPKPYFTASLIGYMAGMLATLGVMSVFDHAQPALLYLVPGVLASLWGTAVVRGEVGEMWEFSEAVTGEQIEEGEGKEGKGNEEEKSPKGLFEGLWDAIWSGGEEKVESKGEKKDGAGEKDEKKEDKKEKKKKPGKNDTKKDEEKEAKHDGLLFSFSISRLKPKTKSSSKSEQKIEAKNSNAAKTSSPALSESSSSDDAVVVSTADLDGSQDVESTPRYRTRSAKVATAR